MPNEFSLLSTFDYTFWVVCLHYYVLYSFIWIIYVHLQNFIARLHMLWKIYCSSWGCLGSFTCNHNTIGFIYNTGIVLFIAFCTNYFSIINCLIIIFSTAIWLFIAIYNYRLLHTWTMGICYAASTTPWSRIAYHSYFAY